MPFGLEHQNDGSEMVIPFESALFALGRVANVTGFGLENLGIQLTDRGTIAVNQYLQTNLNHIYAVGDVAGPFQFTHAAGHQFVNALFGSRVMPAVTYTFPEVARVGLNEKGHRIG